MTVIFDEAAFARAFKSWNGPVGIWLAEKCWKLESLARLSAGYDTGELVASISTSKGRHITGDLEALVGANPGLNLGIGYGYWNHEGTRPHEIRPRIPGGVLRFRSRGMVVYATKVNHPGTSSTKFLTKWLNDLF